MLELLNLLKHQHIIPHLASYIHGDRFNLVFPLAEADLESFLTGDVSTHMPNKDQIWLQAYGLTSAIDSLHNYQNHNMQEDDLEKIGYHHDLKPHNILIKDGTFLLADFGLARLRDLESGSSTIHKYGALTYGAPETVAKPGNSKIRVDRALDIWSWGCILLELVTFALMNSTGVVDFRRFRRTEVGMRIDYCFHDRKELKAEVKEWIQLLRREINNENGVHEKFLDEVLMLIERMLVAEPSKRPSSAVVLRCFQLSLTNTGLLSKYNHHAMDSNRDSITVTSQLFDAVSLENTGADEENVMENLADFLEDDHPVMRALKLSKLNRQ